MPFLVQTPLLHCLYFHTVAGLQAEQGHYYLVTSAQSKSEPSASCSKMLSIAVSASQPYRRDMHPNKGIWETVTILGRHRYQMSAEAVSWYVNRYLGHKKGRDFLTYPTLHLLTWPLGIGA